MKVTVRGRIKCLENGVLTINGYLLLGNREYTDDLQVGDIVIISGEEYAPLHILIIQSVRKDIS